MKSALLQAVSRFAKGRVLVVGDLAIDEMVYGNTARLSREAPVLILQHRHTDIILGAAGNAAHNIAKLGAKRVSIVGVSGKDYYCSLLLDALQRDGLDATGLVQDEDRPTTTKTRISGTANQSVTQQVVRIDRESHQTVSASVENKLLDHITAMATQVDALLLSDYDLGVVTPTMIDHCRTQARKHGLVFSVDSQQDLTRFQGATVVTPNQPEAERNLGFELTTMADVLRGGQALLERTGVENVLITRGSEGMALFEQDGAVTHVPVFNRSEVFDVTGAGDTVIGTLTLALATGTPMMEAAVLGNLAASLVVKRFGASTTSVPELEQTLEALDESVLAGIRRETQASSATP
jgi:rfaE bifunctional protein kinase chain/domain